MYTEAGYTVDVHRMIISIHDYALKISLLHAEPIICNQFEVLLLEEERVYLYNLMNVRRSSVIVASQQEGKLPSETRFIKYGFGNLEET